MKQKIEKFSCKAMYATELLWHLAEVDSSLSVESNLNVVWSIIIIQLQAGVVNKCLENLDSSLHENSITKKTFFPHGGISKKNLCAPYIYIMYMCLWYMKL